MSKVNFIPRGSYILVTSNLVQKEVSTLYAGKQAPEIKEIQQVIAIGPEVRDIKPGDWVMLNLNNFVQTVKKQSTIRAGVGGMEMLTEQVVIPFFSIPGIDDVFIKINSREIEGVIVDYDVLPDSLKSFKTLKEFTLEQEALQKDAEQAQKKGMKFADRPEGRVGLITETGSGMIKMH
jgi:hypothetical protein